MRNSELEPTWQQQKDILHEFHSPGNTNCYYSWAFKFRGCKSKGSHHWWWQIISASNLKTAKQHKRTVMSWLRQIKTPSTTLQYKRKSTTELATTSSLRKSQPQSRNKSLDMTMRCQQNQEAQVQYNQWKQMHENRCKRHENSCNPLTFYSDGQPIIFKAAMKLS